MALIGVDVDPGESVDKISGWANRLGLTWPLAPASNGPLSDYRITQQSAAIGIDATGEIVLRKNGGLQGEDKWREWLDTLGGPRASAEAGEPAAAATLSSTDATSGAVAAAPTTAPSQPTAVGVPLEPTAIVAAPPPTAIPVPTTAPPPPTAVPAPPPTAVPAPPPTAMPRPAPTVTPSPVPTATPNIPVGHNVGQRAPDFTVTSVRGETITLSEVTASGKAVLVYFFATW